MNLIAVYREELARAVAEHPEEYPWATAPTVIHGNLGTTILPARTVTEVADKMADAIRTRSYNKDGRAMRATCKRLGIKYTYTAINAVVQADAARENGEEMRPADDQPFGHSASELRAQARRLYGDEL